MAFVGFEGIVLMTDLEQMEIVTSGTGGLSLEHFGRDGLKGRREARRRDDVIDLARKLGTG